MKDVLGGQIMKEFVETKQKKLFIVQMLYYISLTNVRQGVEQDARVQLQVINILQSYKLKIYLKTLLG